MLEFVTEGLVLKVLSQGEKDRLVWLFTEQLGKVSVRAASAQRTLSKFSFHLNPGNLGLFRFTGERGKIMSDATTLFSPSEINAESAQVLRLVFSLAREMPDARLWDFLAAGARTGWQLKTALSILGYSPAHASCVSCGQAPAVFFLPDHEFLCLKCAGRMPENELIFL